MFKKKIIIIDQEEFERIRDGVHYAMCGFAAEDEFLKDKGVDDHDFLKDNLDRLRDIYQKLCEL